MSKSLRGSTKFLRSLTNKFPGLPKTWVNPCQINQWYPGDILPKWTHPCSFCVQVAMILKFEFDGLTDDSIKNYFNWSRGHPGSQTLGRFKDFLGWGLLWDSVISYLNLSWDYNIDQISWKSEMVTSVGTFPKIGWFDMEWPPPSLTRKRLTMYNGSRSTSNRVRVIFIFERVAVANICVISVFPFKMSSMNILAAMSSNFIRQPVQIKNKTAIIALQSKSNVKFLIVPALIFIPYCHNRR